jgi:uncharacterized protein (DUF983 family)
MRILKRAQLELAFFYAKSRVTFVTENNSHLYHLCNIEFNMIKKGSKLHSILFNVCPECQKGKYWKSKPYASLLKDKGICHENCDQCGLKYEREPGFFYGAMYVSYGLGIAFFVFLWILLSILFPESSGGFQVTVILIGIILFFPLNFWLSRLIWINIFYKFKG